MSNELLEAAKALTTKLDLIFNSESYKAVFTSAYVHGVTYQGVTCEDELRWLKEEIAKASSA